MTDARFLSNNSVTCERNHAKFENLMQDSWAYKAPKNFRNWSKGSPLRGDYLPKSGKFSYFGAAFPPLCADWGEILHSTADPCARRPCHVWRESVQRVAPVARKPDFWLVSKFNTGSLSLPDNPAGNKIWNERRLWRLLKKHLRHQFSWQACYPSIEFCENWAGTFHVVFLTNKWANKRWWKYNLLGGGNHSYAV